MVQYILDIGTIQETLNEYEQKHCSQVFAST